MADSRLISSAVAYGFERKQASTSTRPGIASSTSETLGEWLPEPAFRRRSASATASSRGAPQLGCERQCPPPGARQALHWQWQYGLGMTASVAPGALADSVLIHVAACNPARSRRARRRGGGPGAAGA